jgi:threonine dehydratase
VIVASAAAVLDAASRLPAEVRDTPCVRSAWLSSLAGHPVWLKLESVQPTHSFKVRGAFTALTALAGAREVVTASAGNHGAALAWAAARLGVALTVFTPREAPRAKLAAIASLGASLRAEADDYDDAERRAREHAARAGVPFVSPYNDPLVVAGAGTIGLEILAQVPGVDEIVVPLGGGGLASGVAVAVSQGHPRPRVVAVEPAESPAFTTALAAGRIVPIAVGETIADGLAGNLEAGSITFELVRRHVDEVRRVEDARARKAVASLVREEHLVAEGAAAVAVAAVADRGPSLGARGTVVVLSGSNIDERQLCALVAAAG